MLATKVQVDVEWLACLGVQGSQILLPTHLITARGRLTAKQERARGGGFLSQRWCMPCMPSGQSGYRRAFRPRLSHVVSLHTVFASLYVVFANSFNRASSEEKPLPIEVCDMMMSLSVVGLGMLANCASGS